MVCLLVESLLSATFRKLCAVCSCCRACLSTWTSRLFATRKSATTSFSCTLLASCYTGYGLLFHCFPLHVRRGSCVSSFLKTWASRPGSCRRWIGKEAQATERGSVAHAVPAYLRLNRFYLAAQARRDNEVRCIPPPLSSSASRRSRPTRAG